MTGIVTVLRLPTTDAGLRNELLERLDDVADEVRSQPGTTKYAVLIPRDDDGKTVWVIEEFVDRAASDAHSECDAVRDLNAWLQTVPIFLEPPTVHTMQHLFGDSGPSRPGASASSASHSDTHVVFSEMDYHPGGVEAAMPHWRAVVDEGRLGYGVMRHLEREERLATLEVCGVDGLRESNAASVDCTGLQGGEAQTMPGVQGVQRHLLKKVSGFLDHGS